MRKNIDGKLYAENYGIVSSAHLDPIEKKPLYHFYPGTSILSLGSIGCNMTCSFCQNCDISQATLEDYPWLSPRPVSQVISSMDQYIDSIGLAFTYNEPTIYFEYMMDVASETKKRDLKNVMISNGYIASDPMDQVLEMIDAFNIDLKAFNNLFYKKFSNARFNPVKETLVKISEAGKHLEITNLVIPTLNDDRKEFEDMVRWIRNELGELTILHISRYFPAYQLQLPPTPVETLIEFYETARSYLPYTYTGNLNSADGLNTYCHNCGKSVIERLGGYRTQIIGLDKHGKCISCKTQILKHLDI